jgi:hypothetical protein
MIQPASGRSSKMLSQGSGVYLAPGLGRVVFDFANGHATGFVVNAGSVRPLEAVRRP